MRLAFIAAFAFSGAISLGFITAELKGIHHELVMANCIAMAKSGVTCAEAKP